MATKTKSSRKPTLTTTTERIRDLEEVINGNGTIGLKGKVVQLDTKLDGIKDDIGEIKDSQKWAMRLAITQAVSLVIAVGFYLLNR